MYTQEHEFYVAHGPKGPISICGKMANRHGLIAGATGTGKTVSLQVLAESFSQAGVPCFMADMKGNLSGISRCRQVRPDSRPRERLRSSPCTERAGKCGTVTGRSNCQAGEGGCQA